MNNSGQMLMVGIMIMIMAILIFVSTLPATQSVINTARQCDGLNCAGYVDPDASGAGCSATNRSYMPTLDSNTLSCTILDLMIPFIILGVLIGIITKLLYGHLVDQPQQQAYSQYSQGY